VSTKPPSERGDDQWIIRDDLMKIGKAVKDANIKIDF